MYERYLVILVLLLSFLGGFVKIVGGILYGSRALFVDAMTCIANFVALAATIYFYRVSLLPPDRDHHYGHYKLGFGGAMVSVLAYSFVAGIVVVKLASFREYSVEIEAPLFAVLGFLFYASSILLSKRISEFFLPYAVFTVSELIESIVVIISSLMGALYSYLIDYIGALVLTTYLFIELYDITKDIIKNISDIAPPANYVDEVKSFIESRGFKVASIKIRKIHTNLYHGDIVLKPINKIMDYEELVKQLKNLKQELLKKYRLDASLEIG